MKNNSSDLFTIEACVTSVASAIAAQEGGAHRVELCDNLYHGGTTPGPGSITAARKYLEIDLNVIIRPRGGDFLYTDLEFEIMKDEVAHCARKGVDGIVIGILNPNGTIDTRRMAELIKLADNMSITCHRAFDMTRDPFVALNDLIDLGVHRVLTSGQQESAFQGMELLKTLVQAAGNRIIIMPGVGIDPTNIAELAEKTGAVEFHVHTQHACPSAMEFKNAAAFMGTDPDLCEYETEITGSDEIRAICQALQIQENNS